MGAVMSMSEAVRRAYMYNKSVGRSKIFVAVDIHDTIAGANYSSEMPAIINKARASIIKLNSFSEIVLILYSSSYCHEKYIKYFSENGMIFKYFNENPEVCNSATGDFSKKFYYNLIIDDKAGFDECDWDDLIAAVEQYRIGFVEPVVTCEISHVKGLDEHGEYYFVYGYDSWDSSDTIEHGPYADIEKADKARDAYEVQCEKSHSNYILYHNMLDRFRDSRIEWYRKNPIQDSFSIYGTIEAEVEAEGERILAKYPEMAFQDIDAITVGAVYEIKIRL